MGEQGRYYDEFLWSKRNWPEYTLAFPYREFLFASSKGHSSRQGLDKGTTTVFSEYMDAYRQSLDNGRYENTMLDGGHNVVEYLVRDGGEGFGGDNMRRPHRGDLIDILTHSFGQQQNIPMVDKILRGGTMVSELLECDVQESLNEILWPVIANWTLRHGALLKESDLIELGENACSIEVPVDVLRNRMILRIIIVRAGDTTRDLGHGTFGDMIDSVEDAKVIERVVKILQYSQGDWKNELAATLGVGISDLENALSKKGSTFIRHILDANHDQEYYLIVTNRDAQHAPPIEISAVTSACSDMVSQNTRWRQRVMDSQKVFLTSALGVVDFSSDGDDANTKPIPPELDRTCINFHPQCEFWAQKGECTANPKYMVGTKKTGQCRLACGVCEKKDLEALPPYLSAKSAQFLEDAYLETLTSLLSGGCVQSVRGTGENAKETLQMLLREHSSSHAKIADQMIHARGPITLKTFTPASLDEIKVAESTVLNHVLDHEDAVVALPEKMPYFPDAVRAEGSDIDDSPRSILWRSFNGKCIYKNHGYWSYQLCHGVSVQQYHSADPSVLTPEWSIHLGDFEPAQSSWDIVNTETSLGNSKEKVPAVLHVYEGGSECTVDEKEYDEKFDTGRPEQRKSMVYFMCSPDTKNHMLVNETSRCIYRIEVYIPDLCHARGFANEIDEDALLEPPEDDGNDAE